jgi:hypothetical protein
VLASARGGRLDEAGHLVFDPELVVRTNTVMPGP